MRIKITQPSGAAADCGPYDYDEELFGLDPEPVVYLRNGAEIG